MLDNFFKLTELHNTVAIVVEFFYHFHNLFLLTLLEMIPLTQNFLNEGKFRNLELMGLSVHVVKVNFLAEFESVDIAAFILIHIVHQLYSLILRKDNADDVLQTT